MSAEALSRNWPDAAGATDEAIARLRQAAGVALPSTYIDLLRRANGGEAELPCQPYYFLLYPAEEAADLALNGDVEEFFPGFFIFGSNGGGEYVAFDLRGAEPWPVVYMDMIAGLGSLELLAPTFDVFLELVGRTEPPGD